MMNKFLILLVVATIDAKFPHSAKPGCPCLPEGHASMSTHVTKSTDGKVDLLKVLIGGKNYYYPKNYGQGKCATWDSKTFPSCHIGSEDIGAPKISQPDYCGDAWCYVDKDNCDQKNTKSGYLVGDKDVHYSYDTCGGPNRYVTASRMDIGVDPGYAVNPRMDIGVDCEILGTC